MSKIVATVAVFLVVVAGVLSNQLVEKEVGEQREILANKTLERAARRNCPGGFRGNAYACYRFSRSKASVSDAIKACKSYGGHLAVFDTTGELKTFKALRGAEARTWFLIGGKLKNVRNKKTFVWKTTGRVINFNWAPGHGAETLNPQNGCLFLNLGRGPPFIHWTWNNFSCSKKHRYICEA